MKLRDPSRQSDRTSNRHTFPGPAHVDSVTGCHPHGSWSAWLKVDKGSVQMISGIKKEEWEEG